MTLNLSIAQVRVVSDHAEYGIAAGQSSHLCWRRYRDFEFLRNALSLSLDHLPELPQKQSWWASRSPSGVERRRNLLERFLRYLDSNLTRNGRGWFLFVEFVGADPTVNAVVQTDVILESPSLLREENQTLQENVYETRDALTRLTAELSQRQVDYQKLIDQNKELHGNNKRAQDQILQMQFEVEEMRHEVARLEALNVEEGKAFNELERTKDEDFALKDRVAKLMQENDAAAARIAVMQAEIAELGKLKDQEGHYQMNMLEKMKEEISNLREQIVQLVHENDDTKARLRATLESENQLKLSLAESVQQNDVLLKEMNAIQTTITTTTNRKLEEFQAEIAKMKKEKGVLELEIARLEASQKSAADYGSIVAGKLDKSEKEKADLIAKSNVANKQLMDENQKIEYAQRQIAELETILRSTKEEVNRLGDELDNANEGAENLSIKFQQQNRRLEDDQLEIQMLRKQVASLTEDLSICKKEVEALEPFERQVIELSDVRMKLAERVDELKQENTRFLEANKSLQRQLKMLGVD